MSKDVKGSSVGLYRHLFGLKPSFKKVCGIRNVTAWGNLLATSSPKTVVGMCKYMRRPRKPAIIHTCGELKATWEVYAGCMNSWKEDTEIMQCTWHYNNSFLLVQVNQDAIARKRNVK
jgi:hypothetical protein